MKVSSSGAVLFLALLFFQLSSHPASAQGSFGSDEPTSLRASVNFVWLSDFDSQGLSFSNRLHHYLGERFGAGLTLGLLSSSRFDKVKDIYTIKSTYYMWGVEGTFDVLKNETVAFRLGAGPAARHRSEISTEDEVGGTKDGSVSHIRTADVGVTAFIENDFGIFRNGMAGGRVEYMYYTKGTPVLSVGLHVGYSF
ncbi:hypothetical protein GCM10023188_13410 [Pontibacter saemangeumensis]|uniref:Outer membrane protein beta-barrel domain-containing protein n=1 Tax=Pontibacter saemangeumensis TaxID=1084525 RepID=A0ABP8LHA8_9BACT